MSAIRPPILLIHGIDDTAGIFHALKAYLRDRGWNDVHTLDLQPNNGDIGLDMLAAQVQQYINQRLSASSQIDLVGFSMGGIVGRYYLQRLGGLQKVRRFVTLSSPHNGTWTGYLRTNPGAKQMRPNSDFLKDLNTTVDELKQVEFTSIWTPFDLMIVPPSSSQLPVGNMIQLPILAHPFMVSDARSLATLAALLSHGLAEPPEEISYHPKISA
ncbi:MAG: triacylglycerol lipase [Leptolyngbya sp. SIOISBB]|nr:triacylglycerol lipase [Leptolyngbya sp. SIOISBB]